MDRFNKIVVVSLCDKFSKEVGNVLSQNLGMLFCDTNDLIEYELVDKKAMENLCTKEYLQASEKKVIKHIASFVDVVVAIGYDYLVHNINILKDGSLVIFLKLPKKFVKENSNSVNTIAYDDRSEKLSSLATLTLTLRKTETNFVIEKVIKEIGGIL